MNVPDERALVITYDVKLSGMDGQWLEVTNSASLSGITDKQTSSKQWFKVNHADASVYGSNTSISLTKSDSSNVVGESARLAGAVFELYSVDMSKLPDGDYTEEGLAAASTKVNTVTTDASGSAVLYDETTKALQYDTLYYFKEVKAPLGYAIDDSAPHFVMTQGSNYDAQSALAASHGIHVSPNTVYNVTDTKKTTTLLKARKVYEGGELEAGAFTFELRENGKLIEKKTNDADGMVMFTNIEYDAAGTHTYTISEVAGSEGYIKYDTHTATVTVNVTNDGRGSYYAEATYPDGGDEAVFTNEYHATGQAELAAAKTLNGEAPANGAFSFTLSGADGAIQTVSNDSTGAVKFSPLTYDASNIDFDSVDENGNRYAEFTYTIGENVPDGAKTVVGSKVLKDGTFYDANLHSVTVRVTDDGDGSLEVAYDGDTTFAGVTFGNTHETVGVTGVKEWSDADNQDGIRPSSVTVHLLANNADTGRTATVTADGDWKFSFANLDKYDANGKEIAYTVSEDAIDGYTAEITGSVADGFTITNTHTPETTQVPVRKVWDDANNRDGLRADRVFIDLYADGKRLGDNYRVKLNDANDWSYTFTDLPKYADGKEISYSIVETTSLTKYGYEKPKYSTDGDTFVVTNTHTPETTEVSGTKSWQDNGNADGNRPASLTVHLMADGEEVDSQTITEEGGWSYSFTDLPAYKAGEVGREITYTVEEDEPTDYTVSTVDGGIVNTYERETTSVTVTKAWDDEGDKDGVRPESVTVQLLANGSVYDTVELTAASGWTYTWSDLPKRLNGTDAAYTVSESDVEGYELVSTVGNPSSGYTLTNKHEPESGDAQLTLIKSSTTNSDARLLGAQFTITNVSDPANTETVTTDWDGTATFTKLKRGQTYTLQEVSAPGGYVLDETVYYLSVSNDEQPTVQCISGDLNVWGGQASYWTWLENQPDSGYGSLIVQKTLVGADGIWGNVTRHPEIDTVRNNIQIYAVNVDTGDYFTFQSIGNAARYTRKVDLFGSDGSRKGQVTITSYGSMASKIANVPSGTWWVTEYADGMTSFEGDNYPYSGSSDAWTRTTAYTVNGESTQFIGTSSDDNQLKTLEITNNYYGNGSLVLKKEFGWEYNNLPGTYAGNLLGGKEEGATGATGTIMTNITFKLTGQNLGETYTIKGNAFNNSTPTQIASDSGKTTILVTYTKQQWTITNLPYDTYTVVEESDGYRDNGEEIDTILHKFYTTGSFEVSGDSATTNVSVGNTTGDKTGEGVSESGATIEVNGGDEELDILNIYYRPKVVEATKTWSIPEGVNYTPKDVEVQLVRSVNGVDNEGKAQQGIYRAVTSDDIPEHPGYETRKTLHWNSETNSYDKVVFSQLPAVTANGEQITYEVREVNADGTLVPMVNGSYTDEDGEILSEGDNTYVGADGTTATVTWGTGWSPGKAPYADADGVSRYYSSDKGLTIVNTLETTEVSGSKTWDDSNNQDGKRPSSVTVRLLANGEEVASKSVTAADGWTYDFTALPKYSNGEEIEYTVTEDAVAGYETQINGTNIVNTHKPEKTTVKGEKTWSDASDQDGIRPESIVVRVFNGTTEVASQTVTPDEDGNWSYEFTGLTKYANGSEINYTVTEDAVDGYTTVVDGTNITNTHTPETIEVSGTKTWNDNNNQDGKRPESVTVRLWDGDDEIASTTATAESNWAYSFTDLPKYKNGEKINYTVTEDEVDGYETFVSGFDITNAYQPETVDLSGSKTWDDADDQDGARPESVTVRLLADGDEVDSVTVTEDDEWAYEFTDLPVYKNGERITYTVSEDAVDGYETTYNGLSVTNTHTPETTDVSGTKTWDDADDQDGKRPESITVRLLADGEEVDARTIAPDADGNWPEYSFTDLPVYANGEKITYSITEDAVEGYETDIDGYDITNKHEAEKTDVSGTKTWDDADDQDGKRPTSVTVRLLADGDEVDSATVTSANGWSYSFTDLPVYANGQKLTYTIEEDAVEGYETDIDGYDITNKHEAEKTDVSGTKTWDDADNQDGKRPTSITVRLKANGVEVDSATVTPDADGIWAYSFSDLPVYKNGQRISYTVAEDQVNDYETSYDGYDITNTHTPETTEESGRKAWIDADDQDGARPNSITVRLLADGVEVDHADATADDGWKYSFTDLPKYANGNEITYTVVEDEVADYQTSYEIPSTIMNTHTTEKTSVSGTKVWSDANDQDGKRPSSVTVHLLANGADTGKSATVTADDDWKYEFSDLDKFANGTAIVYTVTEDAVTDYTTSIDGYTITNTHTPEKAEVSGIKTWSDNNNQDGKRPTSVTVRLLADGEEVAHAVVDADSNWAYSFTNLDAYKNGKRIVYTVSEDAVEGYTQSINGTAITNTHTPEIININGTKTWSDANNQDGIRPDSITVRLLANGTEVASTTATAANGWKYSFTGQSKYANGEEIEYTVVEDAVAGYTAEVDGYNVTNTHTPETTEVSGTKTWSDANNQDGIRPTSITVNLLANGTEVDEQTVTAANGWKYTFDDLPAFENGTRITYTVTEDVVEGYTASVNGYDITNTHTPETTEVSGSKTWSDANNQDGIRPSSVTIHLLANGADTGKTTTATADSSWSYSFTGLDKYAAGEEITYTVEEDAVTGYEASYDGYDITNTHTPETTEIPVKKVWSDANDQDGIRPSSVTVILLANGTEVDRAAVVAGEDGDWSYTFTDQPKFANGTEIAYTISEVPVPGYTQSIEGTTVTNTHTPETIGVSGTKTWSDANNQDNIRPASVTVHLLADGKDTGKTATANAENNWTYSFTDLDKYASGSEIEYSVVEDAVEGYEASYDGYDVTNTHTPETTELSGKKVWEDADDQDGIRPSSVTIHLLANGTDTGKTVEATADDDWKYEFTDLDKYAAGVAINYTVSEDAVPGYTTAIAGTTITNTHTPETTEVSGTKTWEDANDQDGIRPTSVTIRLFADGEEYKTTTASADSEGNWSYSFTDLPKYAAGEEIEYTIEEVAVEGYEASYDGYDVTNTHTPETTEVSGTKTWEDADDQDGTRPASVTIHLLANGADTGKTATATASDNWTYSFTGLAKYAAGTEIVYTVSEDAVEGYEASYDGMDVANTHAPDKTSVSGLKVWNDANNQDGIRPSSVTIHLLADGVDTGKTTTATAEGNWTYQFTDLDKYAAGNEISYTVSEDEVTGYTTSIEGAIITNTHTPETIEISGAKTWSDADNQDGIRPTSITVRLLADGEEVRSDTATAEGNWSYSFTNLPKFANGTEIVYTVEEDAVTGYEASYDGFNVTNTHTPETTEVSGTKTWVDANDQDGIRPDSVTVHLLANGADTGRTALATSDNNWTYSFTGLAKYAAGTEIVYTVTEDAVTGYETSYDGYYITNTHTPETTSISGTKVWVDHDDQDGKRPEIVTVHLLADGEDTGKSVEATAEGNWTYSFSELDKYADGKEIKYTVEEDEVDGYEVSYVGTSVVNTHTPGTTEVSGAKTWDDADNQDGIRPQSVTVRLLADGEDTGRTATATAEGNWSYSFSELDKYAAGAEIAYTVEEVAVEGYEASYDGYDVTNTHTPETTEVSGSKTWDDADDQDGIRPASVTVRLLADGEDTGRTATASASSNWAYSFTGLDKYAAGAEIAYTVEEVAVDGYEASYDGYDVTNTHTPETTEVSGSKTWDDADDQDGIRPASVTVRLLADGEEVDHTTVSADSTGNWKYAFTDLPAFKSGTRITYTVTEDAVDGYETSYDGYDVTNAHTPETTEVSGKKVWDDADNQDGARPDSVTVRLLANGTEVDHATAKAEDGWTYSFDNLPKYKAGSEIVYTVTEDDVEDYEAARTGNTITNTHAPDKTSVSGVKVWSDADDQDGARPESVTIHLFANGVDTGKTVTATKQSNWTYEFTDLDKYANGAEILYSVTEDAVSGYTTQIEGFTVTNTRTPETVNLSGAKTWSDANDQDGIRPASVTVRLLANGSEVAHEVARAETGWTYSFTNMPKYANGTEIIYTVTEGEVEGYTATVSGMNVTNTHTPETTEVSGTKTWDDADDQDGIRPASVTVRLLADGEDTGRTATASASSNWAYSFTGLDKYAAGAEIAYTVEEVAVEGYEASYDDYDVTNTHTPETTEVSGTKTWDDADNQDGARPSSITVRLFADGTEIDSKTVTAKSNWSYSFTDLDKYAAGREIVYTVTEDEVDGYATSYNGYNIANTHTPDQTSVTGLKVWDDAHNQDGIRPASVTLHLLADGVDTGRTTTATAESNWAFQFTGLDKYASGREIVYTVTEDAVTGYETSYDGTTVTNTHTPETIEVSGEKTWSDANDQDGKRPESITVHLMADGVDTGKSVETTAEDNWAYSFSDLDKYAAGRAIVYTVTEDEVEGYTATVSGMNVTNAHTPETTEVSGTKTWDDADNQDGIRPASVTVRLLADGEDTGRTATASASSDWAYSFTGLDKYAASAEIAYTVEEVAVDGYEASYDGYDVTNTHTPETTEVSGTKTWDDADDQDGKRPSSITVHLLADGAEVDSATVTSQNGWTYSFTDLPVFKNGERITYTLSEDLVEAYETESDGYDFTNTHTPEKTSVKVIKDWQDENNYDGLRPADVSVQLYADGQATGQAVTLNAASGWAYTWSNLDKYANGSEIAYTVKELESDALAAHYVASEPVYDDDREAYVVTNTHEVEKVTVKGTKKWSDANNQDGKRPETITVDLLANGSKVDDQTVIADENGNWSFQFDNLDKYSDGVEIVYTVAEEQVEGYTATISGSVESGFTIDNAYTPEETEVKVTKSWDDADDQDGMRPDSIKVRLLADKQLVDAEGVEAEVELTADNDWAYTWSGLDRYANGKEIVYSVEEDAVSDYAAELAGSATSGFTLKNTHAPTLVDVSADKVWSDANDQDGKRPDSVEVQLRAVANGEIIQIEGVNMTATLSEGNNWHYEWNNLPQKHNGAVIAYSLVELSEIDGYTTSVTNTQTAATETQNSAIAFTVTNTHTPELVEIPASKNWDDADNQDGKRPASIAVQLYAGDSPALVNGAAVTATLNAENNWATTWTNLPKYANGSEIAYRVVEASTPTDYEKVADGDADNGYVVTNKHETETTQVSAKKVWNDANNQDGKRGTYVTVDLFANGEKVQSGTLNDENDWSITWSDLPKYANGAEIDYTLSEAAESVPEGYTAPAVAKSTADGVISFTVTNTHTPETVEVRGAKTWNDASNQDGVRPASITVNLMKNGVKEDSATVTPDADGNWNYAFTNLPKYADGEELVYSVTEETVEGYTTAIDGYNITNSYKPGETDVKVTKAWDDADNQDGVRPASVKVQLYADGEASGDAVTLNAANKWTYTWTGLALRSAGVDIEYTVAEVESDEWSSDYDTAIAGDMRNGFTITNTHAPEKTTAQVTKVWDDADNQDGKRPNEISVQLLADGVEYGAPVTLNEQNDWSFTWEDLDKKTNGTDIVYTLAEVSKTDSYTTEVASEGTTFTVTNAHEIEYIDIPVTKEWDDNDNQDGLRPASIVVKLKNGDEQVDELTLNKENGWTGSFTHLPKYANGSEIAYTLEEVEVDGYTTTIDGDKASGFTVTNSHTPEVTTAEVLKSWDDANNQDGKRPSTITVQLLANDGAYGEPVTLSAGNGWAYKWQNLPLKQNGEVVNYSVTESGVPDGYTAQVEGDRETGFVITNSYTPGVRNVTVTKAWEDANNQDGVRAGSIKVRLLADNEQIDVEGVEAEVELNADNHWTYTWENLDQMKAGKDIAYTVEEVDVPQGYSVTTAGSADEGYVITNAHTPEETTFTVSKEWSDDNNRDGVRPNGVVVTLLADEHPVATQTVMPDANGNWSYTFDHLPKYAAGEEIVYTVTEDAVENYTGEVDDSTVTNSHDNEKTSVSGEKTWNDNDNQDSTRPESITVRLLADGEEVDSQEVTAADGWAYEFDNLNKFRNGGIPIVYTVEEDAVENYQSAVDGYDVENTLQVGSLTVSKAVRNTTTSATFAFTVTLDDEKVNGVHGGMEFVDGVATFELGAGERIVATDLPAGVGYTVEEADRAGYTATATGATGAISAGENATAAFVNSYSATGTAEFFAMKSLNGRTLGPDEFSFQLLENGQVLQTVQNAGDGHARFDAITYTLDDLGEHAYTIREVQGDARGVTYDTTEHTVLTNVTDNGDGTLNVEYGEYNQEEGVPFENSYAPSGTVELEVNKLLDGQTPQAGAYTFQVADAQGKVYATATNDATGKVKFPALTFKAAGTYAYTISEVVPDGAQRLGSHIIANGVAYDSSTVGVTIEAYDNFDGTMRFETSYDTENPTFNNTSVPDTTFPLTATKVMEGREFAAGDSFTFTVEGENGAPMPANSQVTINPTSESSAIIDFGDITFTSDDLGKTYTYTIKETPATGDTRGVTYDPFGHWVKLTVGDAGDGTMNVTAEYQNDADGITLTNTYEAEGEAVLTATKTLSGRALADGEFFFELTGDNLPATLHASAAADGSITFAPIPFTQEDVGQTYHYTISETQGTLGGVTYDTNSYDVAVSVADNGDGTLAISYDYGDAAGAPVFTNTYEAAGTSAQLTAHKALVGGTLEGGEFTFQLTGASANAQGVSQTATNDEDGMVAFDAIDYDAAGVYQYRIAEVVPSDARDNGDGTFTGADGIVYDGRDHTATVTVTDDGYGALHAAVSYDEGATGVSFGNTELVRTGFAFNKYFFGGVGTFDFTLTAADEQGNARQGDAADYSSAETVVDDGTEAFKATVQNGAFEGDVAQIVFPEISFVSDGDYYYLVEEEESDTPTMIADEAQYLVHVVVEGGQVASTTYNLIYAGLDFGPTTDLSFYNNSAVTLGFSSQSYKGYSDMGQRVSVYPEAKKYLNGSTDQLVGDEFTFELIDEASGTVLAQATNDEFGNIAFFDKDTDPGLAYDEPGTYRYIMREVAGEEANVEYDTSSIAVTVTVVQGEEGLEATTTYNGPGGAEPAFYNVKRGMDVTVQKVSRYGGEGLVDCTYALWMVGENGDALIKEATSDANGYITFTDVTLIAGQKYYFKEVEAPKGHTVDPYRTAYFSLNAAGDGLVLVEATAADGWHSATENIELDKAKQS